MYAGAEYHGVACLSAQLKASYTSSLRHHTLDEAGNAVVFSAQRAIHRAAAAGGGQERDTQNFLSYFFFNFFL